MKKFVGLLLALVTLCCFMVVPAVAAKDEVATPPKWFPEDILASEAKFEKYFRDTEDVFTFEEVDGEYVMSVGKTDAAGYFVLTKKEVPYETYTVTMDVALNLVTATSWEDANGDEACLLVGCTDPVGTGHQVRLLAAYKTLVMRHEQIGITEGETFTAEADDSRDFALAADEDMWITFRFEVYPDEIVVYFEGENIEEGSVDPVYLTGSESSTGESSYLGFRGSRSAADYKIKNLQVYEGIYDPATYEPPVEETEEPTATPEETDDPAEVTEAPAGDADEKEDDGGMDPILIVAIVAAVVVVAGCAIVLVFVLKKKKPE